MTARLVDALTATVAFTGVSMLPSDEAVRGLKAALSEEAFPDTVTNADGTQESTLTLDRERITITQREVGSWVEQKYPRREDLVALGDIAATCIERSGVGEQAPGFFAYQVQFLCDQESGSPAVQYLPEELLDSRITGGSREFLDFSCTFSFRDSSGSWRFSVEPRYRERSTTRIFLTAQLFFEGGFLPSREEMKKKLELVWENGLGIIAHNGDGGYDL